MGIRKELFGKTKNGQEIYRYWIENTKGMKAGVISYGAILVNLFTPDKTGKAGDVVLGYDTLEPYTVNGCFLAQQLGQMQTVWEKHPLSLKVKNISWMPMMGKIIFTAT